MPSNSATADVIGSISVVIPAYNAGRTLAGTIQHTREWLGAAGVPHEIIVVDDGSVDGTADIARAAAREGPESAVRLIQLSPNRGKGAAVRTGMLAATRPWALFMDADNSTSIEHLERFAAAVASGSPRPEVVIASRRLDRSRIVRRQHRVRQLLGRTFPRIVRAIALPQISDTQCGFKMFSAPAARQVFTRMRTERFAFDVEALLLARRLGFPVVEVPVDWDNPTDSTVRMHVDTARMLWDLLVMTVRVRRVPRGGGPDRAA